MNGFKQAGIGPISMDVSKKYSAAVMGVLNMSANLMYYAIANNMIGLWLDHGRCASGEADEEPRDPEDIERCTDAWTWLFAVEAAIFFVSAAVFVMFGTAESK